MNATKQRCTSQQSFFTTVWIGFNALSGSQGMADRGGRKGGPSVAAQTMDVAQDPNGGVPRLRPMPVGMAASAWSWTWLARFAMNWLPDSCLRRVPSTFGRTRVGADGAVGVTSAGEAVPCPVPFEAGAIFVVEAAESETAEAAKSRPTLRLVIVPLPAR